MIGFFISLFSFTTKVTLYSHVIVYLLINLRNCNFSKRVSSANHTYLIIFIFRYAYNVFFF